MFSRGIGNNLLRIFRANESFDEVVRGSARCANHRKAARSSFKDRYVEAFSGVRRNIGIGQPKPAADQCDGVITMKFSFCARVAVSLDPVRYLGLTMPYSAVPKTASRPCANGEKLYGMPIRNVEAGHALTSAIHLRSSFGHSTSHNPRFRETRHRDKALPRARPGSPVRRRATTLDQSVW
jgi:hypothetical protein